MEKIIFHIDVNNAFLSWEATKRIKEGEEDIRSIPSAIGGDREKRKGVILAKSTPAKKYGIVTGEPIVSALKKCPDLQIFKPNFELYKLCSESFMSICSEYTPTVEKYSIDECFLDMSGLENIYPDIVKVAYEIQSRIQKELGFTVNIGIGSNKLLAKMASDFEKPNKVHTMFKSEIETKMWPLPVKSLFTVGNATAIKLQKVCIYTIGDLAKVDINILKSILGVKLSEQLHDYANGIDDSPVCSENEPSKGYSNSLTLEKDITDIEEANKVLLHLSDITTARMRSDNAKALCVGITLRNNKFQDVSHQCHLVAPTNITKEIYNVAKSILKKSWNSKTPIRLIGIFLTSIIYDEEQQITLFDDQSKEKAIALDKAVDSIRNKFGTAVIVRCKNINTNQKNKPSS